MSSIGACKCCLCNTNSDCVCYIALSWRQEEGSNMWYLVVAKVLGNTSWNGVSVMPCLNAATLLQSWNCRMGQKEQLQQQAHDAQCPLGLVRELERIYPITPPLADILCNSACLEMAVPGTLSGLLLSCTALARHWSPCCVVETTLRWVRGLVF